MCNESVTAKFSASEKMISQDLRLTFHDHLGHLLFLLYMPELSANNRHNSGRVSRRVKRTAARVFPHVLSAEPQGSKYPEPAPLWDCSIEEKGRCKWRR